MNMNKYYRLIFQLVKKDEQQILFSGHVVHICIHYYYNNIATSTRYMLFYCILLDFLYCLLTSGFTIRVINL